MRIDFPLALNGTRGIIGPVQEQWRHTECLQNWQPITPCDLPGPVTAGPLPLCGEPDHAGLRVGR